MGTSSHTSDQSLSTHETLFLRGLGVSAGWIVATSAIYFFWQFPAWLAWVSIFIAISVFVYWTWSKLGGKWRMESGKLGSGWPLALVTVVADAVIFATLISVRTDQGIISPWQLIPSGIFLLFALSTAFALLAFRQLEKPWATVLAILHTFCAYSVSLIVYKLGFGFDPFVHEATVRHIIENGLILPKQPFYTGQYVLVTAIHHLTTLSIAHIQQVLVPLLASIVLPPLIQVHSRSIGVKSVPYWILWILPFAYFTFTVPFNLAMVGLVVCLLLLPVVGRDARIARILIALTTLSIHPLIGIPCTVLVIACEMARRRPRLALVTATFVTFVGLFGSLAFYVSRNGGSIALPSIVEWISTFQLLFLPSFVFLRITPWLSMLYVFYYLWPWILVLLGSIGLVPQWRRTRSVTWLIPLATALGVAAAAILSAATLRYRDIIGHEQFEFALRLIALLPWITVPGLFANTYHIVRGRYHLAIMTIGIALLATAIWHVSYPQLNPVMHVFSPGVSRTDFLTVEAIEQLAQGRSYVALVPQLTSAAALRQIGFGRSVSTKNGPIYPYAIPTGGELYREYEGLFEWHDVTTTIENVRFIAPTPILFIALPIAWDNGELDTALRPIAKERILIDESMQVYLIVN